MKIIKLASILLGMAIWIVACGQVPQTPEVVTPNKRSTGIARLELSLNDSVTLPKVLPNTRGYFPFAQQPFQFTQVLSTGRSDFGNTIYRWKTYELINTRTTPITNLTFYAMNQNGISIGGTTFKNITSATGTPIANPDIARSIQGSHGLAYDGTTLQTNVGEADFQAFKSSEASGVEILAKQAGDIPTDDTVLEWGYVVRNLNGSRTINPGEKGRFTFAVTIPKRANDAENPSNLSAYILMTEEPITRVTRGNFETTAQVKARASAIGATEIALIGSDVDIATPFTTKRLLSIATFAAENRPIASIGVSGGYVKLGRFIVSVPSNVLTTNAQFTAERPSNLPTVFPLSSEFNFTRINGAQLVGMYKLTADIPNLQTPIRIFIPVDVPTDSEVITQVYRYNAQDGYSLLRIAQGGDLFMYQPKGLYAQGDTFIVYRALKSSVASNCTSQFGTFNGIYCEDPFDSTTVIFNPQSASTSRARSSGRYGFLSFNVGNAFQSGPRSEGFYCGDYPPLNVEPLVASYRYKLCSYAIESLVRKAIQADSISISRTLDLIALQEVWNDNCSTSEDKAEYVVPVNMVANGSLIPITASMTISNTDRVCAYPPPGAGAPKQIDRLLPNTFDKRCSPIRNFPSTTRKADRVVNGYECIAIRKEQFEFTTPTNFSTIQPACPNATENTSVYYEGSDTGFQVERIRLKGSIGTAADTEFDLLNAHMISPFSIECRRRQLQAVLDRYYQNGKPKPLRLLVAGDFNTDPGQNLGLNGTDNTATGGRQLFNQLFASDTALLEETPTDNNIRLGYLISRASETTADVGLRSYSLDHIISNFASLGNSVSYSCVRKIQVFGTDHKRTLCQLTGFDSAKAKTTMYLKNLSVAGSGFQPWASGVGTGISSTNNAKRVSDLFLSVRLKYVTTSPRI